MRTVCRSGIQSTGGLNGFGELRIVEVISFNKVILWGPLYYDVMFSIQSRSFLWIFSSSEETLSAIQQLALVM